MSIQSENQTIVMHPEHFALLDQPEENDRYLIGNHFTADVAAITAEDYKKFHDKMDKPPITQEELKKLIPKKRAESKQAIQLMAEQVARRQTREQKQDGLVITKAEYGYVPSENKKLQSKFPDARLIDVTLPVAALVDRSQLVVPENTVKVSYHV